MSTITQVAPKETPLTVHDVFSTHHTDQLRYVVEPITTKPLTSVNQAKWSGVDILRAYPTHFRRRGDLLPEARNGFEGRRIENNRKPVQRAKTAAIPRPVLAEVNPARRNTRDDISVLPSSSGTGVSGHAQLTTGTRLLAGRSIGINVGYPPQAWQPPRKSDGSNEAVGFGAAVVGSTSSSPSQDFSSAAATTGSSSSTSATGNSSRRIAPGAVVPFLASQPSASSSAATSESLEKRANSSGLKLGDGRFVSRLTQRHSATTSLPSPSSAVAAPEILQQGTANSPRSPVADYSRARQAATTSAGQTPTPVTSTVGRHRTHLHQSGTSMTTVRRRPSHHSGPAAAGAPPSALAVSLNGSYSDRSRCGAEVTSPLGKYQATGVVTGSCSAGSSATLESLDAPSDASRPLPSGGVSLSSGPSSSHIADVNAPSPEAASQAAPGSPRRRSTSIRRTTAVQAATGNPQPSLARHHQTMTPPGTVLSRRTPAAPAVLAHATHSMTSAAATPAGSSRRVQSVGNRQHRSSRGHHNPPPLPDPIEASLMLGTRVRYSDNVVLMNRSMENLQLRHPTWTSTHAPYLTQEFELRNFHGFLDLGEVRSHHRSSRAPPSRGLRSSAPDQAATTGFATGQIMNITSLLGDVLSVPGDATPEKKGVGPHVLRILPVSVFSGAKLAEMADDLRQCMVCLEDFIEGEKLRWLPCLHTFHCDCIDTWLKSATSCPICKCDVEKSHNSPRRFGNGLCEDAAALTPQSNASSNRTSVGLANGCGPQNSPRQSEEGTQPSSPRCNLPFSLFPPSILNHRPPLVHAATPPK